MSRSSEHSHQQQQQRLSETANYATSNQRLGPGIVLHRRSASPRSNSLTPPPPVLLQHSRSNSVATLGDPSFQRQRGLQSSYADPPLIKNFHDDLEIERIMNTVEKQDHLLYQSMAKGMSMNEYKYELMLKVCGNQREKAVKQ